MRAIDLTPPAIVAVDEAASLADAARLMREECVGDLVITRGRQYEYEQTHLEKATGGPR